MMIKSKNFEKMTILMDMAGEYKFNASLREDSKKEAALQPPESYKFSIIITVGIGFSLLLIFFIIFLLKK